MREVIIGGFVCPTIFAIIWFSVFGGLAIKMERTAEMALQVHRDLRRPRPYAHGSHHWTTGQ